MTKLFETQEAIFKRLIDDTDVMSKVTGVHDAVPDNNKFPYIVLGRFYSTPNNTKTSSGERIEATIDVWSASKGKKETVSIINSIEAALKEELAIEDTFLLSQEVKSREVLEEVVDLYHGSIVFEILLDLE